VDLRLKYLTIKPTVKINQLSRILKSFPPPYLGFEISKIRKLGDFQPTPQKSREDFLYKRDQSSSFPEKGEFILSDVY
jgi:hypothetical protein